MNEKKINAWLIPFAASCAVSFVMAITVFIFFTTTKYIPLLLLSLIMIMPSVVYLFVAANFGNGKNQIVEYAENDVTGQKLFFRAKAAFKKALICLKNAYSGRRTVITAVFTFIVVIAAQICFWLMFSRTTTIYKMNYFIPVILLVMFVVCIIFENWCSHVSCCDTNGEAILKNIRSSFVTSRFAMALTTLGIVVKLLGFFELIKWVNIALAVVFCYATLFIILSLTVKLIRREMYSEPDISIPAPLSIGGQKDYSVLSYLEKNTGITMRSLWSIKLIKNLIPYTVLFAAVLLWICTGLVQVESYQEASVYRFGSLLEETLKPGLHLTYPWPVDKVKVYNTDQVNTLTIGYISTENTDNTWTGTHGSNEYRLLLGGGNELVSINLRIEYKIYDLITYLSYCSEPEKLMEAEAYELVTDRTIVTDLDSLLAADRQKFADDFRSELEQKLLEHKTGLGVVNVVLESIHPPVDIASVYQEIIGAEIKADRLILEAEATAAVKVAEAEQSHDTAIHKANADSNTKIAAATADVAEFMASVAADGQYGDNYRYFKYLTSLGRAYGNSRLVIVGDGIDPGSIFFTGNINANK